jgi:CRISPR/Cas system CMR subunit Cmr4 (Cas7 group RAMP superfamily)
MEIKMEKYIKIKENVYYESELSLMPDFQLRSLIEDCKSCIKEIEFKKKDYKQTSATENSERHNEHVFNLFDKTICYLQSDIVLLTKILKSKKTVNEESLWSNVFYQVAKQKLPNFLFKKLVAEADKYYTTGGFSGKNW